MFRIVLSAALAVLLSFAAAAAAPSQPARTPLDYVQAGDYAAARALLASEVKGRPDAPLHLAFLEAVILERKGDYAGAESVYRQILAIAPKFAPARKALAVLLDRTGRKRAALYQAEQLSATTNDARLRSEMQQYIASQGASKRGGVSLRFALLPSTNANHATSEQTVVVGGQTFILNPASREASGTGLSFGLTGWHTWLLSEKWLATGQLSYDTWIYNKDVIPRQDLASARLDFSGNFGRTAVSFGPRADRTWQDGPIYRDRTGFGASASYRLARGQALGVAFDYYRQTYPTRDYRNGHLTEATPSYSRRLSKSSTLAVGLPLVREVTQRGYLDHTDTGVQVRFGHVTPNGLHVDLSLSYSSNRYDDIYPTTDVKRHDRITRAGVVFSSDRIRLGKVVPQISVTRTVDSSNVAIQSYQSTDYGVSLVKRF